MEAPAGEPNSDNHRCENAETNYSYVSSAYPSVFS